MKELRIETSKGRFVVIDKNQDWCFGEKFNYFGENKHDAFNIKDINLCFSFSKCFKLSEITEDQARNIVDLKGDRFQDYNHVSCCDRWCNTAIESLHSLLKSKGVHLFENNYKKSTDLNSSFFSIQEDFNKEKEAEEKTFYNPYIFKL